MASHPIPRLLRLAVEKPELLEGSAADLGYLEVGALIGCYDDLFPRLEPLMWAAGDEDFPRWLETYQALFREQQALIDAHGGVIQARFIIGIPIADRPDHLRLCLESILQLCLCYEYGGRGPDGLFRLVSVVVAEDSRDLANSERHRALVTEFRRRGLDAHHFGLEIQYERLMAIPAELRRELAGLLTNQPAEAFHHKGQAATRNLSYLKMVELARPGEETLFYLMDSDQRFQVNRASVAGEEIVPALNYFYYINRIFQTYWLDVLTGKLVGDPPVSPAVMGANLMGDLAAFLREMAASEPDAACEFHGAEGVLAGEAAYHDLAALFGYEARGGPCAYSCPLPGVHTNADCLAALAGRLPRFFRGEHLTRRSLFRYSGSFMSLEHARTLYPGNYIVNRAGLRYIIPFGQLRLRMSGPTAGRLIQAEIGPRFASVNLPMLHQRTIQRGAADDFRPGVEGLGRSVVDIGDEFERQFFGDLMLFSVVDWLKARTLEELTDVVALGEVMERTESRLLALYGTNQAAIDERRRGLETWFASAPPWWASRPAMEDLITFLGNVERNFGEESAAWQRIRDPSHRSWRRGQIIAALGNYRRERSAWDRLFSV
jgi:hypothetical protein